jgi:predicted dienelactone hydrolase
MRFCLYVLALWGAAAIVMSASAAAAEPPTYRLLGFDAKSASQARLWRHTARTTLFVLLKMDDQVHFNRHDAQGRSPLPLKPRVLATEKQEKLTRYELEIESRADRRIKVVLTVPAGAIAGKTPAVVCIHGHGGNKNIVYELNSPYRAFAKALSETGYVTLSTDVGQHEIQSEQRTLMGERLWDLICVVDLAASRPEVDPQRIGCGGLSLGGEMAMWLGAMDERVAATISSGFLTTMENLRVGHCMCWDFPGLQRRYEFADIYSMISPRPLQCQNGLQERLPGGFPVELAEQAMADVKQAYRVDGREGWAQLATHPAGHVFDVTAAQDFFDANLKSQRRGEGSN